MIHLNSHRGLATEACAQNGQGASKAITNVTNEVWSNTVSAMTCDPWSVVSFYRRFAKIRDKIGFKRKFDSYAFRHTFAYHFLRKGGTINQLQVLLGHRGIDMTVFMYGGIAAKSTEKTTPYDF